MHHGPPAAWLGAAAALARSTRRVASAMRAEAADSSRSSASRAGLGAFDAAPSPAAPSPATPSPATPSPATSPGATRSVAVASTAGERGSTMPRSPLQACRASVPMAAPRAALATRAKALSSPDLTLLPPGATQSPQSATVSPAVITAAHRRRLDALGGGGTPVAAGSSVRIAPAGRLRERWAMAFTQREHSGRCARIRPSSP